VFASVLQTAKTLPKQPNLTKTILNTYVKSFFLLYVHAFSLAEFLLHIKKEKARFTPSPLGNINITPTGHLE
jgi:hypothetical protein